MYALVAILLTSWFGAVASQRCDERAPLPKPPHLLDWSKMNGTWYETLKSGDVTNSQHTCMSLSGIRLYDHGHIYKAKYNFVSGSSVEHYIHVHYTTDDYYVQSVIEDNEDLALKGGPAAKKNPKVVGAAKDAEAAEVTMVGDMKRYFAAAWCSDDSWKVWIFTKKKVLNPWLIGDIHNDLLKYGITTYLKLGGCRNM